MDRMSATMLTWVLLSCLLSCEAYSVKKPDVIRDKNKSDDTTYAMAVTYELRNDVDRHRPPVELKLELPVGSTIYDVMVEAAQKDWRCGFGAVPNADWGFKIDSVGGVAESSEKGTFWSVERPAYHPIMEGVDKVAVSDGDHVVLRYVMETDSCKP
ncbi:uncharacterized protein [Branchiostoma lanceolatum]|uniref:uncharacterized protein n=1 Tax=Branchiostoma lanceolatum TaxID=7740 RepID=UPI003456F345